MDRKIADFTDKVFYKDAASMCELPGSSVQVIITSPPYFNIKDYSKDGYQNDTHSDKQKNDIGAYKSFDDYINNLLPVWKECERVLKPNGKLCINVPLMPMLKKQMATHYNRDIFDLQSHIQLSILHNRRLVWNA